MLLNMLITFSFTFTENCGNMDIMEKEINIRGEKI